jgi:hypothetical protein
MLVKDQAKVGAEAEGRIAVPGVGEREGLEILTSCFGWPIRRNSVLDGLSVSRWHTSS